MFGNNAPTGAQIRALLGLGGGKAPSLERPDYRAMFPKPRFVPTGTLTPQPKSIGGSIERGIAKGLTALGVSDRAAWRFAGRAMAPLNDVTPVGNVTGAEQGKNEFKRGLSKGDLRTMALGAGIFGLSAAPLPGLLKKPVKKPLQSLLMDESGAIRAWHGTNEIFDQFDPALSNGLYFFSDKPDIARIYGKRVKEADLDFRNPLNVAEVADTSHIPGIAEKAKASGHDGLIIENIEDVGGPQRQFVAFDPPKLRNVAENDATDAHSMAGLLTDPRPTHALYDVGDVLEINGQHGPVVSADADRLVLDLPSGRAIFPRNHPGIAVAPPSKW